MYVGGGGGAAQSQCFSEVEKSRSPGEPSFCFLKNMITELFELTHHFQAHTPPNLHRHLDILLKQPRGRLHSVGTKRRSQRGELSARFCVSEARNGEAALTPT